MGLADECVRLSSLGYSYEKIARLLSERAGQPISRFSVGRYLAKRREQSTREPAHQLLTLNRAMMDDLEKLREEGDLRTASSYYRVIHDNLNLCEKLKQPPEHETLSHTAIARIVEIILEEVDEDTRRRIIRRLEAIEGGADGKE